MNIRSALWCRTSRQVVLIVPLLSVATTAGPGGAATINWIGQNNTVYGDPNNWSPATVPGAGDTAIFNIDNVLLHARMTNTAGGTPTIGAAVVQKGDFEFSSNFTINGITVGNQAGQSATLTLFNGTFSADRVHLGTNVDAVLGHLIVEDRATNGHLAVSDELFVGRFSEGRLTIRAGGSVASADVAIARAAGSTGTATVTGIGSTWTNSGFIEVGFDGFGTLTIGQR